MEDAESIACDTWNNLFYPVPGYKYFENSEQFPFEPGASDFSWINAWWLADAAVLAYVKDTDAVNATLTGAGFDEVKSIGPDAGKSTKGFVAFRKGADPFAIVAFRGTDKDDPRSAVTDAKTLPVERDGYTVHQGFAEALDQVWDSEVEPSLSAFLQARGSARIYFTGHSLGAALATISVTRFNGNCALYTIGSPRVGDDRFVRAVLQRTASVFRFVNSQDIVTQIPSEIPLQHYYRHVCAEKYIDRNAVIRDDPSPLDKGIDLAGGIAAHDGAAALSAIGNPGAFWLAVTKTPPLVDPPPYIVGNHSPNRYPIHIWNYYSRL